MLKTRYCSTSNALINQPKLNFTSVFNISLALARQLSTLNNVLKLSKWCYLCVIIPFQSVSNSTQTFYFTVGRNDYFLYFYNRALQHFPSSWNFCSQQSLYKYMLLFHCYFYKNWINVLVANSGDLKYLLQLPYLENMRLVASRDVVCYWRPLTRVAGQQHNFIIEL